MAYGKGVLEDSSQALDRRPASSCLLVHVSLLIFLVYRFLDRAEAVRSRIQSRVSPDRVW